MSSRFVHVTVVPAATVTAAGPKLKLSIFTSALAGPCCACTLRFCGRVINRPMAIAIGATKPAVHKRLLICFFHSESSLSELLCVALRERRVNDCERMPALHIVHVGYAQDAAQLLCRHLHGSG